MYYNNSGLGSYDSLVDNANVFRMLFEDVTPFAAGHALNMFREVLLYLGQWGGNGRQQTRQYQKSLYFRIWN